MIEKGSREEGGRGKFAMASSSIANQSPLPTREAPSNYHPYPSPLAKYEDVVTSRKLFMDTLEKLHAAMGTKFMIPIIGGKDLDLHQLFVEVTSRGGIEKVLRERRWKEVTAIFSFPSSATNASFILRKYYVSLLHHYEQIYFFKAKGWTPLHADALQNLSTVLAPPHGLAEPVRPSSGTDAAVAQPQRIHSAGSLPGGRKRGRDEIYFDRCRSGDAASNSTAAGSHVIGVIDGKFESGYLITVTIGTRKLKGVLYHAPQNPSHQVSHHCIEQYQSNDNSTAASGVLRRRRRKKSEMKKRDPSHPKPNRSGYNFFFAEQHARLKPLYPGKDREISRMIGELWNKLKEPEKVVYQEKAIKDKERYKIEMEDYRERLRTGQIISNAVPIQQLPLESDVHMMEPVEKIKADGGDSPHTPEHETSSGQSDKSNLENDKTADKDSSLGTSPGAEIGAESVGMENLAEEEAAELQKRVDKVGREITDCWVDVPVETKKELLPCKENESVRIEEKESVPCEDRILVACKSKE